MPLADLSTLDPAWVTAAPPIQKNGLEPIHPFNFVFGFGTCEPARKLRFSERAASHMSASCVKLVQFRRGTAPYACYSGHRGEQGNEERYRDLVYDFSPGTVM